jgi:integrase
MPSVTELKGSGRKSRFRAQVKRKGFKTEVRFFLTRKAAWEWATDRDTELRRQSEGLQPTLKNLQKQTVGNLVEWYLGKKTPKKASAVSEELVLRNFLAWKNVKDRPVLAFDQYEAIEFRDYLENEYRWIGKPYVREGKPITPTMEPKSVQPATVRRQIAVLQNVWDVAAAENRDFQNLPNPWKKVRQTNVIKARKRRLRGDELSRLLKACLGCYGMNRWYAQHAIQIAIATGMREQEIFNLLWHDLDFQERTITITKSKTDYKNKTTGRTFVLPRTVEDLLYWDRRQRLKDVDQAGLLEAGEIEILEHDTSGRLWPDAHQNVIPLNKERFKQIWHDIVKRAGIPLRFRDYIQPMTKRIITRDGEGLTFHDLRREARTLFHRAGLTEPETQFMLGHKGKSITDSVYLEFDSADRKMILDKLDKYSFGETQDEMLKRVMEEIEAERKEERPSNVIKFKRKRKEGN